MIEVEVIYALPEKQCLVSLSLPCGSTVQQAIVASGLLATMPDGHLTSVEAGIFGKPVGLTHVLEPGDRVEIYRPLQVDPRRARQLRAQATHGGSRGTG